MAKVPPVNELQRLERQFAKLYRALVTMFTLGVAGAGTKVTYDQVRPSGAEAATVALMHKIESMDSTWLAAINKVNTERKADTDSVKSDLKESQSKLWQRSAEIDTRTNANATAIAALVEVQRSSSDNLNRLAITFEKANDRHENRIHELEKNERRTP